MYLCFYMIFPLILVESSRITDRFETALNRITKTGGPVKGKIKRYRCIEEYVTLDDQGNAIEGSSEISREFTTTTPPVEERKRPRMHGVKNFKTTKYAIPPYKMKMYSKKKKHRSFKTKQPPTTTSTTTTTTTELPTTTPTEGKGQLALRPKLREHDDPKRPKIRPVSRKYPQRRQLNPRLRTDQQWENVKDPDRLIQELYLSPMETNPQPVEPTMEPIFKPYKQTSMADDDQSEVRYSPAKRSKRPRNDIYDEDYDDYDSYAEYSKLRERQLYRQRLRGTRRLFPQEGTRSTNMNGYYDGGDDFIVQPRQRNRPISPRIVLPIATDHSLRSYIHQTKPQVIMPLPIPAATTTIPNIQTLTVGNMEMANEDSCAKVVSFSKIGGISDVWTWSKLPGSCELIQTMIQNIASKNIFTCQQIWHFIDSCKAHHLL